MTSSTIEPNEFVPSDSGNPSTWGFKNGSFWREEQLIASVSHELTGPLTCLKLRLNMAQMQPERIKDHLAEMESITDQLVVLVGDLLDTSRLKTGQFDLNKEAACLQDLVRNAVEQLLPIADAQSNMINVDMPATPILLHVDARRIKQVFTNLISNAIKYNGELGTINIRVFTRDSFAIIEVQDSGIGIPPELLDRIFEPFFRVGHTGHGGTGLGLTIAREIVEAHGGRIVASSLVGKGSRFGVELPRYS